MRLESKLSTFDIAGGEGVGRAVFRDFSVEVQSFVHRDAILLI